MGEEGVSYHGNCAFGKMLGGEGDRDSRGKM